MTTLELRKRLIAKIRSSQNDSLLEEVYRLFELEADDVDVYELNEEQIEAINEARDQINSGKYLTNDEANRDIDQWLNK